VLLLLLLLLLLVTYFAGHMARGGTLTDYEGGGPILSGPNFLTLPCDVLIPAALGGVINAKVAERLQCKVGVVQEADHRTCLV
jgi:glutamate dehydrogenase/leucine dehydrogenase